MMTRNVSTVLTGCLLACGLPQAHAAILVELSGAPSSSTVTYSFSGSGTWLATATRNAGLHFNSNNSQSNFVDANFAANVDVTLSGGGMLTNTTTGLGIAITGLRFTDSLNGDDWSLLLAAGTISGTLGDTYVISGSGTFSLGSLTFGNLIAGNSVSNVGTGTSDFGPATLAVVPESAAFGWIAGACTLGFAVTRRRRAV